MIRVGDTYYLVASSFQCTPGLPLLSSRDLVNWTIAGHALTNLPDPRYAEVRPGEGIWAPALREHDGTFYIFAPTPDEGIYVLRAPAPTGPWSAPELLLPGKGLIDPCPLWDDDGKAYLVHAYARSRAGIRDRLRVRPMSPDARQVLGEGQIVFHDPVRQPTIEGPKFYKRDGWYYILAPAGGVPRGWQLCLRSRRIFGPYEARVVLEQGSTAINGPHQGALVDTPAGQWWFLHFQDAGLYGRVVHLNPVHWEDGWPLMGAPAGGRREPVLRHIKPEAQAQAIAAPETNDEFSEAVLGLQWQWHGNHRPEFYSLAARRGQLRLFALPLGGGDLGRAPNVLLQKLPARAFAAETELELAAGEAVDAGLVVMGQRHAALTASTHGREQRVALSVDNRVVESIHAGPGPLRLRVVMADGGACRFSFLSPGQPRQELAATFQAEAGRWIGAKVGLFVRGQGHADFRYFRFDAP